MYFDMQFLRAGFEVNVGILGGVILLQGTKRVRSRLRQAEENA